MSTDGVLGAVWLPTDGWLDPSGLAQALAAGARKRGRDRSGPTPASSAIGVERGRVTGVEVELRDGSRETIAADVVVNAGGMFAPEIGRLAGVTIPIIPMAHQYLFTEAIEGVHAGLPQLRDPDNLVYFREEVGGLCMGGYERNPAPWSLDGVPPDFNGKLLAPDWPRFEEIMAGAVRRVPGDRRRRRLADDQRPGGLHARQRVHPRRERTSAGSSSRPGSAPTGSPAPAGSVGRSRRWIVDGEPELDLWQMDIRRFGGQHWRSREWTLARTTEVYATYYDIHYPNEERQAGRPLRTVADVRAARGPRRGLRREVAAGSGPNWFEPNADDRAGAAGPRSRPAGPRLGGPALVARRSRRRRSRRGSAARLFDETSFAKIEVIGQRRGGVPRAAVRERGRRPGRARSSTPRC